MSFIFERLLGGVSPNNFLKEHHKALSLSGGLSLRKRIYDPDQGVVFYCLSVGGGPEGVIPGRYLFFFDGFLSELDVFCEMSWNEGVGHIINYRVNSSTISNEYSNHQVVKDMISEVLQIFGLNAAIEPKKINIIFN